jgi:hypothetical protein
MKISKLFKNKREKQYDAFRNKLTEYWTFQDNLYAQQITREGREYMRLLEQQAFVQGRRPNQYYATYGIIHDNNEN